MRKIIILLICLSSLVIMTACGDSNTKKKSVSHIVEEAQKDVRTREAVSSDWPENEFTKLVPRPENVNITGNQKVDNVYYLGHRVVFANWAIADIKAYVEKLKAAGFTIPLAGQKDVVTQDTDTNYSFDAQNKEGMTVSVGVMGKNGMISISKHK